MSLSSFTKSLVHCADGSFKNIIIGIQVQNRAVNSVPLQQALTKYGCSIHTRVGLHDVAGNYCSPNGTVIVTCEGEEAPVLEMIKAINGIKGVNSKTIEFDM
ncbi:hypothetical protein KIPB_003679 [Kipferlia bialata]|uniref:Uncharacterized protein n=1 Tax=Kipferlia bialata TaxID=797122 RepID=A0A9K3CU24_9EUKA|nr:hypothetical protein KIPB_003679 [Kipferlia bialata]|eukprot:g3679.t1